MPHQPLHLIDGMDRAVIEAPSKSHVQIQTFALHRLARPTVFQHPISRITWPEVRLEAGARLETHLAVKPSVWERIAGPVVFRLLVREGETEAEVFSETVDARSRPEHRAWLPAVIPLGDWQGRKVRLVFETAGAASEEVAYGWVGWGDPCVHGAGWWPARPAALAKPARPPGKPDIFLITCDALRADHLGCYGAAPEASPNMDRLAAEGVRLDHARAPSDTTLGTYATMLTGLPLHRHGVKAEWGELPAYVPTLPALLTGAGWHTLMAASEDELAAPASGMARAFAESLPCLGNPAQHSSVTLRRLLTRLRELDPARPLFTWLQFFEPHPPVLPEAAYMADASAEDPAEPVQPEMVARIRGVETMVDFEHSRAALASGLLPSMLRQRLEDSVRALRGTLAKGPDLASHLEALGARAWNGHTREGFIEWLAEELHGAAANGGHASAPLLRWLQDLEAMLAELEHDLLSWLDGVRNSRYPRALYAAAVKSADDALGRLMDELRAQGRYDEALIILTAPHGEFLHEHPRVFEHHVPAEVVLRVPCIVKPPASFGWQPGRVVSGAVGLAGLPATVLDLAGVSGPGSLGVGHSFRAALAGAAPAPSRDIVSISMQGSAACIHRGAFKLVRLHHADLSWPWLPGGHASPARKFCLFRTDPPDETLELSAEHPELLAELAAALEAAAPEAECLPPPLEPSLFHNTGRRQEEAASFQQRHLRENAHEQDRRTVQEQSLRSAAEVQREAATTIKALEKDVAHLSGLLDKARQAVDRLYGSGRWRIANFLRRGRREKFPPLESLLEKFSQWKRTVRKPRGRRDVSVVSEYESWLESRRPDAAKLQAMHAELERMAVKPRFGLVMHLHSEDDGAHLARAINSVQQQMSVDWRLFLVGAETWDAAKLPEDGRITHLSPGFTELPEGITHFAALGAQDWIEPHALAEVALALAAAEVPLDLVFTDEDEVSAKGVASNPFLKPGWSPDTLESMDCVGALAVWSRSLLESLGAHPEILHPRQAHAIALRAAEKTGLHAVRVPHVLYHRRAVTGAVKMLREEQALSALTAALARRGEFARVLPFRHGIFHVSRAIYRHERVTILIPTRDRLELLRRCIESLTLKTCYENYEIVIINNDSRDPWTQDWLARCGHRVFDFPGPFNYAAMHNAAVKTVDTPWLCFLNNDTEITGPHWLSAMAAQVQRPEIGTVGAKLLFPDGTVQHAGVVLGIQGRAAHAFANLSADDPRARAQLHAVRNCSAVTAACMMVRRSVFEELGGFDARHFAVAYNDVDFGVRALRAGYRNVVTPHAVLVHHECASRPRMDIPAEVRHLSGKVLGSGPDWSDPFYHPLLNHRCADFTLDRAAVPQQG